MQHLIERTIHWFFKTLEFLVVACMVAMVVMVFGNVLLRYGMNSGITVSDEMSRYCFIWLTYIGAMVAMRDGAHLGVDTLIRKLSLRGKKICFVSSSVSRRAPGYNIWCSRGRGNFCGIRLRRAPRCSICTTFTAVFFRTRFCRS